MESPTVTVPTTQVYYHRETGLGLRMDAGDVITQRKAYLYQVSGATNPTNTVGLVTAITAPQDGDVLVYDAASGTWINAPPVASGDPDDDINHIYNGKFASADIGTEGWSSTDDVNVPLTREQDGEGVWWGKVVLDDDTGGAGIHQKVQFFAIGDNQNYIGQTWQLTFEYRGEDTELMVLLDYSAAADDEAAYLTATEATQTATAEVPVLSGNTSVDIGIFTNWNLSSQVGKTYWVTNVKLLRTAEAP